uniref:Secreted protein n=1 Tax=Arundo donax TaxID=35708 RepID=A0A0A8ZL74_ARUDO
MLLLLRLCSLTSQSYCQVTFLRGTNFFYQPSQVLYRAVSLRNQPIKYGMCIVRSSHDNGIMTPFLMFILEMCM